jgi:hypothetical protein
MAYYKLFNNDMQPILRNDFFLMGSEEPASYKIGQTISAPGETPKITSPYAKDAINFCEGAANLAYSHFLYDLGIDVKFVEIEPIGKIKKWNQHHFDAEYYSAGIKLLREIPKKEFTKLCINDFPHVDSSYLKTFNWMDKIEAGLFKNKYFDHLYFFNAKDIEALAFNGTSVENLTLKSFLKPDSGIKNISAGMLHGINITKCLMVGMQTVIQPGALNNTKISTIKFGKHNYKIPAKAANKNGAKLGVCDVEGQKPTLCFTDAYGNFLQKIRS